MQRISQSIVAITLAMAAAGASAQPGLATGLGALLDGMQQGSGRQQAPQVQAPSYGAAPSAEAWFTGQTRQVELVTGGWGTSCEYSYFGRTFWRAFRGSCPQTIQIQ